MASVITAGPERGSGHPPADSRQDLLVLVDALELDGQRALEHGATLGGIPLHHREVAGGTLGMEVGLEVADRLTLGIEEADVAKRLGLPFHAGQFHFQEIPRAARDEAGEEDLDALVVGPDRRFVRELGQGQGINAATGEYGDLVVQGVIDPVKVTRSALENAASIAGMLLTTEALVVEKKEKAPEDGGGHGHGHAGHTH